MNLRLMQDMIFVFSVLLLYKILYRVCQHPLQTLQPYLAICQQYSGIYHKVRCDDKYIATDRQEEFEDTKKVIRIRKSKKNRQHNSQKKKYKAKYRH